MVNAKLIEMAQTWHHGSGDFNKNNVTRFIKQMLQDKEIIVYRMVSKQNPGMYHNLATGRAEYTSSTNMDETDSTIDEYISREGLIRSSLAVSQLKKARESAGIDSRPLVIDLKASGDGKRCQTTVEEVFSDHDSSFLGSSDGYHLNHDYDDDYLDLMSWLYQKKIVPKVMSFYN